MTTTNTTAIMAKAMALIAEAESCGVVITIETKPELPLAMGNHMMHVSLRPARELDPVTVAMIEDIETARLEAEKDEDDEWTCSACGGPMYRQPHWGYGQCDDCGKREKLEPMEP